MKKPGRVSVNSENAEMKTAIFRWVLLAAAVLFIVLGIINGDPRSVMAKAVRICMECIGLG